MENAENTKDTVEAAVVADAEPVSITGISLPWNDVAKLMFQSLFLFPPILFVVCLIYAALPLLFWYLNQ